MNETPEQIQQRQERGMSQSSVIRGDCRVVLNRLAACSVQCVVTSPPYWRLRDYDVPGQIGQEATVDAYVATLVDVFRRFRRCLRDDGTVWLNLGDTWRAKNLVGVPWRVAFALQDDGWYLRSDVVWHKTNAMPENVKDRPTRDHEYLFLFAKRPRYYYDARAIAKPTSHVGLTWQERKSRGEGPRRVISQGGVSNIGGASGRRNARTVWSIAVGRYKGQHTAAFPPKLIEPCVLAGTKPGDVVLDPFGGVGTTGLVANRLGRDAVLIELNERYAASAKRRIRDGK